VPKGELLGEFEMYVLAALERLGDEAYGVTIARELETQTERDIAIGSVYVTLDRLETKGFVTSVLGSPIAARGGRAKRHFSATAEGVDAVRDAHRVFTALTRNVPALRGQFA
jgi:DNA-binding PadR family transcriptional regulator